MAKKRKTTPVRRLPIKENNRADQALQQIKNLAAEFFDAGVVILSKEIEGKTGFHSTQFGNEFAIKGMVNNYVNNFMDNSNEDMDWEGEWADDDDDDDDDDWKKEKV